MSTYTDKALDLFAAGYNCSQAVSGAFSDVIDAIDEKDLMKLAFPFGGGFARTRGICGAASGMGIVYGLFSQGGDPVMKTFAYEEATRLAERFSEMFGSLECRDLYTGVEGGNLPAPHEKLPCRDYVKGAAQIAEDYLRAKGIIE